MLRIERVSKTFRTGGGNEVRALSDVSLDLHDGSFLIIIGTNGSGKSTLLNAVAGAFFVDSGTLQLAGEDITREPEHRRARLIGRVFQNPSSGTAPNLSIAENLALAARRGQRRGLGPIVSRQLRAEIGDRVRALKMGLENRLDAPIGTLSGGQRQALTLLMATWRKPDLLLLDEHTAALDPKSADQVIQVTSEIVARDKLTTLMVTHSMQQAVDLGDRIVMMHKGRVLHDFRGTARAEVTADDLLARFESLRRSEQLEQPKDVLMRGAAGGPQLMAILQAAIAVDARLDQREIALVQEFAQHWGLAAPDLQPGAAAASVDLLVVRRAVEEYLRLAPPPRQATELLDVLHHIWHADADVSAAEAVVHDEVAAMIAAYAAHRSTAPRFEVVVVPQDEAQRATIAALLPGVAATSLRGGTVYSVGRFHSAKYADLVCERYVAQGLFTTRIEH